MPPSNKVQCLGLRGVSEGASARDCSITRSEAPDAAPGVCMFYGPEFVRDVRSARATGAADVGRSNWRWVVECASAGGREMVSGAEIGSTRGMSRSAKMVDGYVRLESSDVSDVAKRENIRTSRNAEIDGDISNLRSVGRSKVHASSNWARSIGGGGDCGGLPGIRPNATV
jgi:hypothetical protein